MEQHRYKVPLYVVKYITALHFDPFGQIISCFKLQPKFDTSVLNNPCNFKLNLKRTLTSLLYWYSIVMATTIGETTEKV